jgi:TPP-dependent trihydroxycyclohexane-1,2-dione (THcHDO) dehydratase
MPERDVICMVGDGSYMMANSELATAVMMGIPFTVVLTDNRGFGCINRLQKGTGGAPFNNLLKDSHHEARQDRLSPPMPQRWGRRRSRSAHRRTRDALPPRPPPSPP